MFDARNSWVDMSTNSGYPWSPEVLLAIAKKTGLKKINNAFLIVRRYPDLLDLLMEVKLCATTKILMFDDAVRSIDLRNLPNLLGKLYLQIYDPNVSNISFDDIYPKPSEVFNFNGEGGGLYEYFTRLHKINSYCEKNQNEMFFVLNNNVKVYPRPDGEFAGCSVIYNNVLEN